MASRQLLTRSEEGLVRALASQERVAPRASFAASLRERLVAEAAVIEAETAEAFHRTLEGAPAIGQLAELAQFATALAPAVPMRAPDGLRGSLREQLLADAAPVVISLDAARTRRRSTFASRLTRRLAVAAALSGMLVSGSAFALSASADDTPVDSLYGLKLFRERAQTWFISGVDEGVRRIRFADTRVDETEAMVARSVVEPAPYETALDGLQVELMLASTLIIRAHEAGDPAADAAMPQLAAFVDQGRERLAEIEEQLPPDAQPEAAETLTTFDTVGELAESALEDPIGSLDPSTDPGVTPCATCGSDPGEGDGSDDGDGGILPRPNPRDSKDPDDKDRPGPIDEGPLPDPDDPIPTPLPEPDRIPDLPGRIDDELEDLVARMTTDLVDSL